MIDLAHIHPMLVVAAAFGGHLVYELGVNVAGIR
jgi:hypothetical protein